jgi:hypothetical protein
MFNLRELRTCTHGVAWSNSNGLLFPLVAAGPQPELLTWEDRVFIRDCIIALSGGSLSSWQCCQAVLTALQSFWATDEQKSLEEVARDLGLELGLF